MEENTRHLFAPKKHIKKHNKTSKLRLHGKLIKLTLNMVEDGLVIGLVRIGEPDLNLDLTMIFRLRKNGTFHSRAVRAATRSFLAS